ncbi:hypothetical protein ACTPEO_05340 [Clostridioides difficile]
MEGDLGYLPFGEGEIVVKDVKLKKGMCRDEVNRLLKENDVRLELIDEIYGGVDYKYNWRCECGGVFIRTWYNIRSNNRIKCKKCSRGIKEEYKSISDVRIGKGMTKDEINKVIGKWLLLEDEIYLSWDFEHNWKCKCGNIFQRKWNYIQFSSSINCKNCNYLKLENKYKYEVEKNGDYEYIRSFRTGEKLPSGKTIDHPYIQVKHLYCNKIYEVLATSFINSKQRCGKCCGSYENSFAYYIEKELGEPIEKYWDFEKNIDNPYIISKKRNSKNSSGDNLKVWIKCVAKDYHESYLISCNDFVVATQKNRNGCPYCHKRKIHKLDSLGVLYPSIAYKIVENVDIYTLAPKSDKKYYFKCEFCGNISNKKISLNNIIKQGYSCKYCSDGVSIPEKLMSNILKQLKLEFKTELNKSDFDWIDTYRYDFYIELHNLIIEVNGIQHYKENQRGKTLKEEQENDRLKRELALLNGIEEKNYIVIDCRNSELTWLKENITKSLGNIFDLSNVDWNKAWEESQDSLCVKAWELWNRGIKVKSISKELDVSKSAIRSYLKKGNEINKCSYDGEKEAREKNKYIKPRSKKIKITYPDNSSYKFSSIKELCEFMNISRTWYYNKIVPNNNIINLNYVNDKLKKEQLHDFDGCRIEFVIE